MLRSGTARTATQDEARGQQSLGELVSLALKDISKLVNHEIALAKRELKIDVTRAAVGAGAFILLLFVTYPLIIMLLFAGAYGLHSRTFGQPIWAGFLWMALLVFIFMIIAFVTGIVFFKKITGMKLTRKTVADDISMLKQVRSSAGEDAPAITEGTDRAPAAVTAGPLSG